MKKSTKISPGQVKAAEKIIGKGLTLADASKQLKLEYNRLQTALKKALGAKGYGGLMKQSVQARRRKPAVKMSLAA